MGTWRNEQEEQKKTQALELIACTSRLYQFLPLCAYFLTYKTEMIIMPTSQGYDED